MKVVYWGKIHRGDKAFGLLFLDFPKCFASYPHQLTLRECATHVLQSHIDGLIGSQLPIPEPSCIELPVNEQQMFVGYLPVIVEVPDTFVKGWRGP